MVDSSGGGSTAASPNRTQVHEVVSQTASLQAGCVRSSFHNGVSLHRMPESMSFTSAKKIMDSCTGQSERVFVGTIDGTMVISLNFNHDLTSTASSSGSQSGKKKKRQRDPHEEAAQHAIERVNKGVSSDAGLTDQMLQNAKDAVYGLLSTVKGAQGEAAVESYGLSFKAPEGGTGNAAATAAPSPPSMRPKLILSARLAPGVAVSIKTLFAALGSKCSQDGMLTVQDGSTLANGFNLPLSEQARAAVSHGQKAVSLFATVSQ